MTWNSNKAGQEYSSSAYLQDASSPSGHHHHHHQQTQQQQQPEYHMHHNHGQHYQHRMINLQENGNNSNNNSNSNSNTNGNPNNNGNHNSSHHNGTSHNHHQSHQQQQQHYHQTNLNMANSNSNNCSTDDPLSDPTCNKRSRAQQKSHCNMQLLFLFASAVIALILFILLVSHGVPWTNFEIFLLSIVTIVLMASLVGFTIGSIRHFCWATNTSSNPTPMTMYTNPPPIGSVEAEFQNEYIPVFPMRQLKPRVDLDMPHQM